MAKISNKKTVTKKTVTTKKVVKKNLSVVKKTDKPQKK